MTAEIGIFGGSVFDSFLEDVEEVELETPFVKHLGRATHEKWLRSRVMTEFAMR